MLKVRNDESIAFPQIKIPELKFDQRVFMTFTWSYDKRRDVLFIHQSPRRADVSLDVGGDFWIRFIPETGEVVGIEVEDFEKVFLVRHPELGIGWAELRPCITKRFRHQNTSTNDYLRLLYQWVRQARWKS